MSKLFSTVAALVLFAVLGAPANAQSRPAWTQAGMLRCVVNPSIGFIIAGHQSMECTFTQNAPIPPQAYAGALNTALAVVVATLVMWVVMALVAHRGSRARGAGGLLNDMVTRFMGLIVIAMGVQFALTGPQFFRLRTQLKLPAVGT